MVKMLAGTRQSGVGSGLGEGIERRTEGSRTSSAQTV